MKKKRDFPKKICPVCGRDFVWRKRWKTCWDEVKYCSQRCRHQKRANVNNQYLNKNSM